MTGEPSTLASCPQVGLLLRGTVDEATAGAVPYRSGAASSCGAFWDTILILVPDRAPYAMMVDRHGVPGAPELQAPRSRASAVYQQQALTAHDVRSMIGAGRVGESHSLSIGCGSKGVMAIGLSHQCASERLLGFQRLIGFQPCRAGRGIDAKDNAERHRDPERDDCRRPRDGSIPVPQR